MIATLEMFFFGVLACSTLVATCMMIINFSRIRAGQEAVMTALRGLAETHRLGFEALTIELNKLDERVKELERHA
jgi:hypothetical protein